MIKFVILALAVAMVSCQYGGYKEEGHEEQAEPHYNFEYSVNDPKTGDIKGQKEERKGELTQGEYYLVEPDGSKRIVKYHVEGKSGFIAEVHREPAKGGYEQPKPSYEQPKPSYEQPKPSYEQPKQENKPPAYYRY